MSESFSYHDRSYEKTVTEPTISAPTSTSDHPEQPEHQQPLEQKTYKTSEQQWGSAIEQTKEALLRKLGKLWEIPDINNFIDKMLNYWAESVSGFFDVLNNEQTTQKQWSELLSIGKPNANEHQLISDDRRLQHLILALRSLQNGQTSPKTMAQKLNLHQELAHFFEQWLLLEGEKERGRLDEARVQSKIKQLLQKFPFANLNQKELQKKSDAVGRLTFEAFLDDALSDQLKISDKLSFSQLYQKRETSKITQLGEKMSSTEFAELLKKSSNNLRDYKHQAYQTINTIRSNTNLSDQEKQNQIRITHEQWQRQMHQKNEYLNRQELICAMLERPFDIAENRAEVLRGIQHIGQLYYNVKTIRVDGKWGPQTQSIVMNLLNEFENQNTPHLKKASNQLKIILNQQKHFEGLEKQIQLLTQSKRENSFDTFNTFASKERFQKAINTLEKTTQWTQKPLINETEKQETALIKQVNKDSNILKKLSLEQIQEQIPQDRYLAVIKSFLDTSQAKTKIEQIAPKTSIDTLAQDLLERNGSWVLYENLLNLRDQSWDKQELFKERETSINKQIELEAGKITIETAKRFFESFGIRIQKTTIDDRGEYFTFTDASGKEYYYRPSSWKFSTLTVDTIDRDAHAIENGENYEILLSIPRFDEFLYQARELTFLPPKRQLDKNSFDQTMKEGLRQTISHNVGTIEHQTIKRNIESAQIKAEIITKVKKLIPWIHNHPAREKAFPTITEKDNPLLYSILLPICNTLNKNIPEQLTIINDFFTKLDEAKINMTNKTNLIEEVGKNRNISSLLPKNPKELFMLHLRPDILKEMEMSNTYSSKQFELLKTLTSFHKEIAGRDSSYNQLNTEKIKTWLTHRESPQFNNNKDQSTFNLLAQKTYTSLLEKADRYNSDLNLQEAEQTLKKLE